MKTWQRRTLWVVGVIVAIGIAVGLTLWLSLRSGRMHQYLLNTARQRAAAAVGAPVQLGNFQLHFGGRSPSVDIEGIALPGLSVAHAHVGVQITSLLHRTWNLSEVELDHPVVHVNQLPKFGGGGGGGTNVFDLGIRHVQIRDGEVMYQNRSVPISADVRGVQLQARFDPGTKTYTGQLAYGPGTVEVQGTPLASQGTVRFTAASMADVSGQYQLAIAAPQGEIAVQGTASYRNTQVVAQGEFSSPRLAAKAAGVAVVATDLRGHYGLANGDLAVTGVQAEVLGGAIAAQVSIGDVFGAARGEATVTLRGMQVSRPQWQVAARANATVRARWRDGGRELSAGGAAALRATVAGAPAAAEVGATYAGGVLTIQRALVQAPSMELTAAGSLDHRSAIQVNLRSDDLAATEALADRLAAAFGHRLPAQNLGGRGVFTGTVAGTAAAPRVQGVVTLSPFRVRGRDFRSVDLAVRANPSEVAIPRAAIVPATGGSIVFAGSVGLENWRFGNTSPVRAQLRVRQLRLETTPLAAVVEAEAQFYGSLDAPSGHGQARLAPAVVRAGGESVGFHRIVVGFEGTGTSLVARLSAQAAAGTLEAGGSYDARQRTYTARVEVPALALAKLPLPPSLRGTTGGTVALHGQGQGSLADPAFQATLTSPSVTVAGQRIDGMAVGVGLAQHRIQATLAAAVVQAGTAVGLHGTASVGLGDGLPTQASLDAPVIPLAPFLAAYAPALAGNLQGETAVEATFTGPLRDLATARAQVTIPRLQVRYGEVRLAAAQPIQMALGQGALTIQPAHLVGTDTDLELQGSMLLAQPRALQMAVRGRVNFHLAQVFAPDLATGGELVLDINAHGPLTSPNLGGTMTIQNLSLVPSGLPLGLQGANGVLRLSNDRLDIASFSGRLGGGTVTASGGIAFRPTLQFSVAAAARGVNLRYPPTVREAFNADLNLTGSRTAARLGGRVQVESVSVTPQFDFATFLSQVGSGSTAVAAPGSFTQDVALDVAVTTPNQINASSRDFSLQGGANVTIRGTAAEPVVLGRVTMTSGDLIFRGDRYVIQSGTLDFVNPARTEPNVNLTATTTIQQYDLNLHFQGPVETLHTTYTSDPPLPPADIINLLAFGQTTEASAANPTPGNLGAENLIAGAVTSQITDRVQRIAGISQLSVDPILGGGQQSAGARVTIQQRVTGNLFVTISTDVTGTARNVIEIQYKLSPRTSISGVRDQNGGFGVTTRFNKVW